MIHGFPAASQNAIKAGATGTGEPKPVTTVVTAQPTANQTPNGWLSTYDVATVDSHENFRELRSATAVWELGMSIAAPLGLVFAVPACIAISPTSSAVATGCGVWGAFMGTASCISGFIGSKLAYKKSGCCDSYAAWHKDSCTEFKQGIKDIHINFGEAD